LPPPPVRDKPALRAFWRATVPFSGQIALAAAAWASGGAPDPGIYEITASTQMPHLEENLRYATTRERRCLQAHDLAALFPILRHPSLEGCKLGIDYALSCASPQVATGYAHFDTAPGRISASLEIKMGGTNMTFSERIDAVRQGDCRHE
jgi:hypothetical protein